MKNFKLFFGVSLIISIASTVKADSYTDILNTLGIEKEKESELPVGLLEKAKNIGGYLDDGKRAENEGTWKEEQQKFKARGEDIKKYITDGLRSFFKAVNFEPIEYMGVLMDVPINVIMKLIEKAPWEEWKGLFDIYMANPRFISNVAKANKKLIFSYYKILFGDKKDLDNYLELFMQGSEYFDKIRIFASALLEQDEKEEEKTVKEKKLAKDKIDESETTTAKPENPPKKTQKEKGKKKDTKSKKKSERKSKGEEKSEL